MTVFGDRCSNDKITNESVNIRTGHISNKSPSVLVFSIKKTCHKINLEKSYHILLNVELENFHADGEKCAQEEAEQVGPVLEHACVDDGREDSYTSDQTASPNSRFRPAITLTPDQQTGNKVLKVQRMTINLNSTIHMYVL